MSRIDTVLHYPELYDRPHNGTAKRAERISGTGTGEAAVRIDGIAKAGVMAPEPLPDILIQPCVTSFLRGQCKTGHVFVKALVCGREWCPDCGKDNSVIHLRRVSRWWPKVMQMKKVGYLVVTIPEELRETFKSKTAGGTFAGTVHLKAFRKYLTRKLQRMGYDKGLSRYHWAGDCPICEGHGCKICRFTGADSVYKPHLNILIEQGYMNPDKWKATIDVLKNDLQKWFNTHYKAQLERNKLPGFKANIFFSYCGLNKKTQSDKPHRIHKLKYITRSTFRHYNQDIAAMLKGFRTTSVWGKWKPNKEKKTSDLVTLENGHCPECLKQDGAIEAVTWGGFINVMEVIQIRGRKPIEGGYFLLTVDST